MQTLSYTKKGSEDVLEVKNIKGVMGAPSEFFIGTFELAVTLGDQHGTMMIDNIDWFMTLEDKKI